MEKTRLIIDTEFQKRIRVLKPDEYSCLENSIKEEGCRDPLIIWDGFHIIVDGMNRYEICTRLNFPYQIKTRKFKDRNAVISWMLCNQLSRRNLTPDEFKLTLGELYNLEKQIQGTSNQHVQAKSEKAQSEPFHSTASKIASEHGVSPATVKRAGKFAEAVDTLKDKIDNFDPKEHTQKQVEQAAIAVKNGNVKLAEEMLEGNITPDTVSAQMEILESAMTVNNGVAVVKAFFIEVKCLAKKTFAPKWMNTINEDGKKTVQKDFKIFISDMEAYQDLFIKKIKEIE